VSLLLTLASRWGCDKAEDQANLTLKDTNKRLRLKDDVAFTLLTTIYLHMIATLNEIDNIFVLDVILNGEPIGLGNHFSQQHGINIRESSSRGDNRSE
jgi:hypothetical protein